MRYGRWIVVLCAVGFLIGAGLLGAWLAQRAADGGIAAVDAQMASLRAWGWVSRLALVGAVVGGWPWWVVHAARRGHWPPERTAAVAAWRGRVLGWFAVFEIVIVQDGYGRLVRWLVGGE